MLAIYVPKITNRIRYTFAFVFTELIITDYKLYDNFEEFIISDSNKLIYSKQRANGIPLLYSKKILFNSDIVDIDINSSVINSVPVIFTHENKDSLLSFDPFAAIFYMISRYEEYNLHNTDIHQRYIHTESIAFKNNFLDKPIVHLWAEMLEEKLLCIFPKLHVSHRKYQFLPTIDVDHAYKHINNGFSRVAGGLCKAFFTGDLRTFNEKLGVIFHIRKDPYDTFDFIIAQQEKYNINFIFFFLMACYGGNDKSCFVYDTSFRNLIRHVGDYCTIGMHSSYASFDNHNLIEEEKQLLEDTIHSPIIKNRQHFLRFNMSSTYPAMLENGICEDYSMGYAEITGFRAGTCIPFYYFDLENNEATKLKIFPLSVMDCTLFDYMRLDSTASIDEIKHLIEVIKQNNGMFIPLWHNSSLSNVGEWKNKAYIFREMIEEALP